MLLSTLPPSVLALILDGNSSWAALELWKTGDRAVRDSLTKGGIRHVLLYHRSDRAPVTWPRCLKEFQLLSLSLRCCVMLLPAPQLRAELLRLHPRLEALELKFPNAIDLFTQDSTLSSFNHESLDKTLTSAEERNTDLGQRKESEESTDSDEPPPKRSKLTGDTSNASLSNTWMPSRAFPSLTSLSLAHQDTKRKLKEESLSKLPETLKSLKLDSIGWLRCDDWAPIESLTIIGRPDPSIVRKLVRSAPKTLTELNCTSSHVASFIRNEAAYYFPLLRIVPHLVHTVSSPSENLIPSHVQHVVLHGKAANPSVLLPDAITDLELLPPADQLQPILNVWPLNLASLVIDSTQLGPQHLHLLPRTLVNLDCVTAGQITDATDPHFWTLGAVTIKGRDASQWSCYKEELLAYGKTRGGADMPFVESYIERVENGALFGLPVGLRTLKYGNSLWLKLEGHCLPPRLRTMHASAALDVQSETHFFGFFPPFISNATLNLTMSGKPPSDIASSLRHFINLPYIRSAAITIEAAVQCSALVPLIPRSITSLTLTVNSGFPKADMLLDLPPNLKTLILHTNAIAPSDSWLHALPRFLTSLGPAVAVTASDLANLPPQLEKLSISVRNLTINDLLSLPRSLRSLTAVGPKNKRPGDKPGLVMMPGWDALMKAYQPFWRIFQADRQEIMRILRESK